MNQFACKAIECHVRRRAPPEGRFVMPVEPSRELVLTKLHHCFPDQGAAAEALGLIDTYSGDTPTGRARVQLAMLKQCGGDLRQLRQLADVARTDYRDVLVGAEYPEEFSA